MILLRLATLGSTVARAAYTTLGRPGFPSNREGFPYAAAGWSAASLSYWMGDIKAAELCRRRLL